MCVRHEKSSKTNRWNRNWNWRTSPRGADTRNIGFIKKTPTLAWWENRKTGGRRKVTTIDVRSRKLQDFWRWPTCVQIFLLHWKYWIVLCHLAPCHWLACTHAWVAVIMWRVRSRVGCRPPSKTFHLLELWLVSEDALTNHFAPELKQLRCR